jgi:1-acyl-sn-glycerol-3-phosphate acyltransferase
MQWMNFIFLKRKWDQDKIDLTRGLETFRDTKSSQYLLIFPEGTVYSPVTYQTTQAYAQKANMKLPQHVLIPRSTGLLHALNVLKNDIEGVYDLTVGIEGIVPFDNPEEQFPLMKMISQNLAPKKIHISINYTPISQIPMNENDFQQYLYRNYYEKDRRLDAFLKTNTLSDNGRVVGFTDHWSDKEKMRVTAVVVISLLFAMYFTSRIVSFAIKR